MKIFDSLAAWDLIHKSKGIYPKKDRNIESDNSSAQINS